MVQIVASVFRENKLVEVDEAVDVGEDLIVLGVLEGVASATAKYKTAEEECEADDEKHGDCEEDDGYAAESLRGK